MKRFLLKLRARCGAALLVMAAALAATLVLPCRLVAEAASTLQQTDVESIRQAVEQQLLALSEDDADEAFALATPSIREQMGSPENFLRVIKEDFSPIYRHLVVLFSQPKHVGDDTIQLVHLTDSQSRVWLAIYSMVRDTAGSWKIDGCQLVETSSVSV